MPATQKTSEVITLNLTDSLFNFINKQLILVVERTQEHLFSTVLSTLLQWII